MLRSLLGALCLLVAQAHAQCPTGRDAAFAPHDADLIHLPTPHAVVDAMLRLAAVSSRDVVYDLGAGDGRIPIAAARDFGARAVGIELDGKHVEAARCHARAAGLEKQVEFRQQDLLFADLRDATVVTLFLFPELNRRLALKLREQLRPGTRIVSHRFSADAVGRACAVRTTRSAI